MVAKTDEAFGVITEAVKKQEESLDIEYGKTNSKRISEINGTRVRDMKVSVIRKLFIKSFKINLGHNYTVENSGFSCAVLRFVIFRQDNCFVRLSAR